MIFLSKKSFGEEIFFVKKFVFNKKKFRLKKNLGGKILMKKNFGEKTNILLKKFCQKKVCKKKFSVKKVIVKKKFGQKKLRVKINFVNCLEKKKYGHKKNLVKEIYGQTFFLLSEWVGFTRMRELGLGGLWLVWLTQMLLLG